jgi:hypothetical protein
MVELAPTATISDAPHARRDLARQLDPLPGKAEFELQEVGDVAARAG